MFMRYTHFGIGHSPMLRRIMRDCLVSKSAAQLDGVGNCSSEEADREFEEVGDDNGYEEYADEEVEEDVEDPEESGDELSDGELVDGDNGDESEDGDEFDDDLSF